MLKINPILNKMKHLFYVLSDEVWYHVNYNEVMGTRTQRFLRMTQCSDRRSWSPVMSHTGKLAM